MAEQTIDRLSIEINAKANASVGGIDKLAQSIQRLKSAVGGGADKLSGIAASIDRLKAALSGFKGASGSVNSLAKSLERLQAIKLEGVGAKLTELSNAAKSLGTVGESLQSIRDFGKGMNSLVKSVEKLQKMNMNGVTAKVKELAKALRPLTDEMRRAGSGMGNFGSQIRQLIDTMNRLNARGGNLGSGRGGSGFFGGFNIARIFALAYSIRRVGRAINSSISSISDYIEDLNLFSVAMGTAAEQGMEFAQSLQDAFGVNAGQAMKYMGVFQQITSSMGIASDKAYILSKNFTQLGYDIASFYNVSNETAFTKLQSGLTGQVRPLRDLGIDISQARLQQELYTLGINESVRNLSQADKAQLRYIATLKQAQNALGDMGRTLMTPANMLRVLQGQLQITARNIGSIFIPALNAILPYAIAVVRVIGELAARLAQLVGFKMPEIIVPETNLPPITDEMDDLTDSTADAKKQINQLISGFDELNILQKQDLSSAGGVDDILGNIELPEYDPFEGFIESNVNDILKRLKDWIENLQLDPLTTLSDLVWGLGDGLIELGKTLVMEDFPALLGGIAAGLLAYGLTGNPILAIAVGAITTALLKLLPHKQQIEAMSGILATLAGALMINILSGGKIPLPLAQGISLLLTSGLIKLFGKQKAIKALGIAFTGLATGLLVYKGTHNLPLALAVGAATAALARLATQKSTMEVAPALLAGVSTALVAFKWGKFSPTSAGLLGLGAAITTFAKINDMAPELKVSLIGIGTALEGAAIGLQLFGVKGALVGGAAGVLAGLGIALWELGEKAKQADLEKRFGDITLSMEEIEDVAKRLTKNEWTVKIDAAIDAKEQISEFEENIKSSVDTLNKLNWKVSVGLQLTESEVESYKQSIDSFVQNAKSYIQQKQYAVDLAIDAILKPGTFAYENLKSFTQDVYGEAQNELDRLGKELSDIVNEAFADGILSDTERINIQEKQAELQKVIDRIADAEFKAKLKAISLDSAGTNLTSDSFMNLQKKIQEQLEERLKSAEELRASLLVNAEWEYPNGGADYERLISDIQKQFNDEKATIILQGVNVSLDVLKEKYSQELSTFQPMLQMGVRETFENGFNYGLSNPQEMYNLPLEKLFSAMSDSYFKGFQQLGLDRGAQKAIAELVNQLRPTQEQLTTIAENYKSMGQQVPESIRQGLNDISTWESLSGDLAAKNYLLGKSVSTDPSFLELLATAKDAGLKFDATMAQGLTDNLNLVTDSATGAITGIQVATTGEIINITPILQENLSQLGLNVIDNGLIPALDSKKGDVFAASSSVVGEVGNGANSKQTELTSIFSKLGIQIPADLISSLASKNSEVQTQTVNLLTNLNTGVSLKQPELENLFSNLGISASDKLIGSLASKESSTQTQVVNLLSQISRATDSERGQIISKIGDLGIDVGDELTKKIDNKSNQAYNSGKGLLNSLWDGLKSTWSNIKSWFSNLKIPSFGGSGKGSRYSDYDYYSASMTRSIAPFREQAATFRALSPAPTIAPVAETFGAVPVLSANNEGGAVRTPSYTNATVSTYRNGKYSEQGVAESYQRAIVSPNGNGETEFFVEAIKKSLVDLVAAEYQMHSELIEAIRDGQNVSVQVDGKELGKVSAKYIRDEQKRTGKNPAMA